MSYLNHDGHSATLSEPNAGLLQETAHPTQKRMRGGPAEHEPDEIDALLSMSDRFEEVHETARLEESRPIETGVPASLTPPVIPLPKNKVYGRYRAQSGVFELELRVDIDGPNPLQKISGDYYQISGQTKSYFGSFIVDGITKTIANGVITITGVANTTWSTSFKKIKLAIKQTLILQPLAPAFLQWFHVTTNAPGALYVCNHFSWAFRTVRLEQDHVQGVAPFVAYNTGSLPSGGPARVLSINTAYQEAGVEMVNAGLTNVTPVVNLTPPADLWSNAELHQAMVTNFSLYQSSPQWASWLLHAYEHEYGPGLYGIMFDSQGASQRHGCAVFYKGIGGNTADQQRLQLYTCVHELGHTFNLLHSWQKNLATPPKPNIPNSLSWMNYPWNYPQGGAPAFWNAFPFHFDPVELTHIRHGFRNNVIMGGNPFITGSALENMAALFEEPIENHSPLSLELEAKNTYLYGEPVCLETKLKTNSMVNTRVTSNLHADYGFVTIGIKKPGGELKVYEPLAERCTIPATTVLNSRTPSIYESSYIGFDKDGFIFDQPGYYQIKAVYHHEDGSRIVSNTLSVRVKNPVTAKDDEAAELMLQDDTGYLLSFLGSDAPYLQKGNDSLQLLNEKYKDHPLSVYAQFVRGVNAQRFFKSITEDKKITAREPDYVQGGALLHEVIDKSKTGKGLDNISLNQAMQTLAKAYYRQGNKEAADNMAKDMVKHFDKLPIKEHVKEGIRRQAATMFVRE